MSDNDYVHGYSDRESERLRDQANALTELLHHDTSYPPGHRVLEAGCGVGAQTVILAGKNPETEFVSVDISKDSLAKAKERAKAGGLANVTFQVEDIYNLSFPENSFHHVFVCFVLEHLRDPPTALASLKRVLRPGGSITLIEGDHGSAFFYPDSREARRSIQCLIDIQGAKGGDALIGRRLYPLLLEAGFEDASVSPRMVYVDAAAPHLVEAFTLNTFTAMVESVRDQALDMGLIDEETWDRGIRALNRTAEEDGTFCYTFFKASAVK